MSDETTQPLSQEGTAEGGVAGNTRLTPTDQKVRGSMCIRPTTVVPVIFVPGIMGSNLKDATTGASIWNTNSTLSILLQWIFRSASTRQKKLVPSNAAVDDSGKWYGKSATIPDQKTGKARGEGTTSKAFYGDFVRWLDDSLNGHGDECREEPTSPWKSFEDQDFHETWHTEKPFVSLTKDASEKIWDNFYCPVHVHGYNWLASNGDAGQALAKDIKDIIAYWQSQTNPAYKCEQVILVSHSMGGLVTRAAVHKDFGGKVDADIADKVVGIVHGEQPANGAAAAYHHCRNGYGGISGLVLGRNPGQVTAVFANAPGAMQLLPNQQYVSNGKRSWLKARFDDASTPVMQLPESDPYLEIYLHKDPWWRLTDPSLIDPLGNMDDPWGTYTQNVTTVSDFHFALSTDYHPQTYVHYGADAKKHPAYGDLVWNSGSGTGMTEAELYASPPESGSNPVTVVSATSHLKAKFSIVDPGDVGYPQPGDETVPACSGEAPNLQGGGNIKQSFRLTGFEHQAAYNNDTVRNCTLYAIGMLLQQAKKL